MEYKIRTVFQMLAYCIYPLYKLLNGRIIGNIQYITTDYRTWYNNGEKLKNPQRKKFGALDAVKRGHGGAIGVGITKFGAFDARDFDAWG
jgi:hypothetical protein